MVHQDNTSQQRHLHLRAKSPVHALLHNNLTARIVLLSIREHNRRSDFNFHTHVSPAPQRLTNNHQLPPTLSSNSSQTSSMREVQETRLTMHRTIFHPFQSSTPSSNPSPSSTPRPRRSRRRVLASSAGEDSGDETEVLRRSPRVSRENCRSQIPMKRRASKKHVLSYRERKKVASPSATF